MESLAKQKDFSKQYRFMEAAAVSYTHLQLTRVSDTDALTPQTETAGNGPPQKYRYDYLKMEPKLILSLIHI